DPGGDGRRAWWRTGSARAQMGGRRGGAQAGRPGFAAERASAGSALPQGGDDPGSAPRPRAEDQRERQAQRRREGGSAELHHRVLRIADYVQRALPGPRRRFQRELRQGQLELWESMKVGCDMGSVEVWYVDGYVVS